MPILPRAYRRFLRRAAPGAFFVVVLVSSSRATGSAADPAAFDERIEVEIVNVDVAVSDARGRPVVGLERADFQLFVDGERTEITHFSAGGKRLTQPTEKESGSMALEDALPEGTAPEPPPDLVVYLDDLHLGPSGRRRTLDALGALLERRLEAGARVMLMAHDQDHHFLLPPTRDHDAVNDALAEIAALEPSGAQRWRDQANTLRMIAQTFRDCAQMERPPCVDCLRQMIARARSQAQVVEYSRGLTLGALHHLVAALGTFEGRKELLLVSDGLAVEPGLDLYDYILDLCPGQLFDVAGPSDDNYPQLDLLAARANANRVTLHTLEASGIRGPSAAAVDFEDRFFVPSTQNDSLRASNVQDSLVFLAGLTGGRAILDTNQPAVELTRLDGEQRGTYSLGFAPGHPAEGRTHRVKVGLRGRKGEVRYRRTYFHKEVAEDLAEKTLGAALLGAEKNPLAATVTVGEPVPPRFSEFFRVPLEISIPPESLVLLPREAERSGQIKAVVAAPLRGGEIEVRHLDFDVRLPAVEEPGQFEVQFGIDLDLLPGEHQVGIGLHDALGGQASFLRLEIGVTPRAGDSVPAPREAPDERDGDAF